MSKLSSSWIYRNMTIFELITYLDQCKQKGHPMHVEVERRHGIFLWGLKEGE